MNQIIIAAFACAAGLLVSPSKAVAQGTLSGTVSGGRTPTHSSALEPVLVNTRVAPGLYSTAIDTAGGAADRLLGLGSMEAGVGSNETRTRRTAGLGSGAYTSPTTTTYTAPNYVGPSSTSQTDRPAPTAPTSAAPQSRGTGIVPEGSATPQGRQSTPRPPGEQQQPARQR